MIVIGHPDVPYEPLRYVETAEEIADTPADSLLWLGLWSEAKELAAHCRENGLRYAVMAESVEEAVLANALHATFIVADAALAPTLQKVAETYLFDAKILVPLDDGASLEPVALEGIDGVLYQRAIVVS